MKIESRLRGKIPDVKNDVVEINPDKLSGAPVFAGTRVPIKNLFDYLEGGETLEDFLEGFPPVTREPAIAVLDTAGNRFLLNHNTKAEGSVAAGRMKAVTAGGAAAGAH